MNVNKKTIFRSEVKNLKPGDELGGISKGGVTLMLANSIFDNKESNLLINDSLTARFKITYYEQVSSEVTSIHEKESKAPDLPSFEKLLDNEEFSDAKIIVDNRILNIHKCILSARSEYFSAMFTSDMKESKENQIEVTDMSYNVMLEVLRFIYAGKVNDIDTLKVDLLIAADKYVIEGLKVLCEKALIQDLKVKNIVDNLVLADRHHLNNLKIASFNLFKVHKQTIMSSTEFKSAMKSLSATILISLIEQ